MTKLVLKPPTQPKIAPANKVTIKKYTTKPVATTTTTTESRSTLVATQTTFRVRNIPQSAAARQRRTVSKQASNTSQGVGAGENVIPVNGEKQKSQQPGESAATAAESRPVEAPILQEITSTVVNCSNANAGGGGGVSEVGNKISPSKCTESNENVQKCSLKSYDPIKARQFIQAQRRQRHESTLNKSDGEVSKEDIRRRLTALHQSSLQIVGKNVKRAREKSVDRGSPAKTAPKKLKAETQIRGLFDLDVHVSTLIVRFSTYSSSFESFAASTHICDLFDLVYSGTKNPTINTIDSIRRHGPVATGQPDTFQPSHTSQTHFVD